jgi:hypothetical protein
MENLQVRDLVYWHNNNEYSGSADKYMVCSYSNNTYGLVNISNGSVYDKQFTSLIELNRFVKEVSKLYEHVGVISKDDWTHYCP